MPHFSPSLSPGDYHSIFCLYTLTSLGSLPDCRQAPTMLVSQWLADFTFQHNVLMAQPCFSLHEKFLYLQLNTIRLRFCAAFCLSIHLWMDTWLASSFWQLWIMLPWTWVCKYFWGSVFNSLGYVPRCEIVRWNGDLLRSHQTIFRSRWSIFHSHQQGNGVLILHNFDNIYCFLWQWLSRWICSGILLPFCFMF